MKMHDARIAFFGTPQFAVYVLEKLHAHGIVPNLIITAPDRPAGRGLTLTPPPVKNWAREHTIPTLQPITLKQVPEELTKTSWDLFIVAAYGKILSKEVIDLPKYGVLNVHPSLLPKFRGASPVESQILADEKDVGVSIMLIDEEMDHGPIVAQETVPTKTWPMRANTLEELLARKGGEVLAESIPEWLAGTIEATEQDHERATYCTKIQKADGEINLHDDGYQNYLKFCAYDGWPGTYFFQNGKRIKITNAEFTNGEFRVLRVIPEGKKEIDFKNL